MNRPTSTPSRPPASPSPDPTGGVAATVERAHSTAPTPSPGVSRRSGLRRRSVLVLVSQVMLGVFAIGLWEVLSRTRVIDPFYVSRPSDIASRIGDWVASGDIFADLRVTLLEALLALLIGTGLGLALGFAMARVRLVGDILDPYVKMLNALPRVVLAPIFLLVFGLGIWSKVAFGVTLVFFIVFFNTYQGIREVETVLVNNIRLLGANERQLLRHVFLPSAVTWIFSSLHVSVGFAIVGAVVGEYLGASHGVGYIIAQAEGVFDTTGVYAGMAVLSVVVLVVDVAVQRLERHLLRWKPTARPGSPG